MISLIRITVIVFNVAWLAWAWWRSGKLRRPLVWRLAAVAWFAFIMGFYFWLTYARFNAVEVPIPVIPLGMTYIWALLVLAPLVVCIVVGELLLGAGKLVKRTRGRRPGVEDDGEVDKVPVGTGHAAGSSVPDSGVSRREFLWATAVAGPPALTIITGLGGYLQTQQFRVRRLDVDIPGLAAELDGATIAHVSDVHAGKFVDEKHLSRIANAVNDLRADIVLATGDLIDFSLSDLPNALDTVRRMDAPGGVYMCEGNHDLFQSREQFEERVRAANVGLLINEVQSVRLRGHDVQIVGLRWGLPDDGPDPRPLYLRRAENAAREMVEATAGSRRSLTVPDDQAGWQPWTDDAGATVHLDKLRDQIDPGAPTVVLAHHPHAFDAAAELNLPLTLAGHTHGGQLMLTKNAGAGPMMYRYWSGLYRKGNSRLVVSNGVGNWLPLRINAPAELVHVTLRRG